jgi:hypothetical protein
MSNPAVIDQIIASNPDLAAMGPQVREVFQSERFQEMMLISVPISASGWLILVCTVSLVPIPNACRGCCKWLRYYVNLAPVKVLVP